MNTPILTGFYSLKKATAILAVPSSQILRYALYDKLPLYMVLNGYLPDNEGGSFLVNAGAKTTYGRIDVPDELLSLAISIYESVEDEQASGRYVHSAGFDSTNWFPEQAARNDGSVITFDKDLYKHSELSFEDLLINGDELNRLLIIKKKLPITRTKNPEPQNSELTSIDFSKAINILVELHMGYIPTKANTKFIRNLQGKIKDKRAIQLFSDKTATWDCHLHEYGTRETKKYGKMAETAKLLAINHHRPYSDEALPVTGPDIVWLDEFYQSLPDNHRSILTKLQWRNILSSSA